MRIGLTVHELQTPSSSQPLQISGNPEVRKINAQSSSEPGVSLSATQFMIWQPNREAPVMAESYLVDILECLDLSSHVIHNCPPIIPLACMQASWIRLYILGVSRNAAA